MGMLVEKAGVFAKNRALHYNMIVIFRLLSGGRAGETGDNECVWRLKRCFFGFKKPSVAPNSAFWRQIFANRGTFWGFWRFANRAKRENLSVNFRVVSLLACKVEFSRVGSHSTPR